MSGLIYKQRCASPNKRDTPINNKRHVEYIATRPGAIKDENTGNALFGKLMYVDCIKNRLDTEDDKGFTSRNIPSLKELLKYVESKSKEKTCFYRATISLREEDAIRLGYLKREHWQEMIDEHIYKIAEKMNIPSSTLEWVAGVHMEKGHPHLHLVYWDGKQDIRDFFVKPAVAAEIRKSLLKDVFQQDFSVLFKEKDEAKKNIGDFGENFLCDEYSELADIIRSISPEHNLPPVMYSRFSDRRLLLLAQDIYCLRMRLPKTGSLKYAYMSEELKNEINRVVFKILNENKELNRVFNNYITSNVKLAGMYISNQEKLEKAKEKAEAEATKILGNKLLTLIKKINIQEWESVKKEYKKQNAFNIILELFNTISQKLGSTNSRLSVSQRQAELSKQAKKELAKRLENASNIDWER